MSDKIVEWAEYNKIATVEFQKLIRQILKVRRTIEVIDEEA